jgi:hypothetical protein
MCVGNGTKEQEANKDTFICNLQNLFNKQTKKLWQKHKKNPMNVHMWVNENKESMFYGNEYGIWDLISMLDGDISFTIGIQIEWQMQNDDHTWKQKSGIILCDFWDKQKKGERNQLQKTSFMFYSIKCLSCIKI